ncbi:hypothetical protein IMZ48_38945 [Candidatus Bathyarchaeota archaeon]|nr:hypothetical protein [Candidatus Bathyarchaeota archaeon]
MADERSPPGSAPSTPAPAAATPAAPASSPPAPSSPAAAPTPAGILPPDHWAHQDPVDESDAGSALGDEVPSSTASVSSSIMNYRTIHGRTYHSEIGGAHYWYCHPSFGEVCWSSMLTVQGIE